MNKIITYAGRFQPFCKHHYESYKHLQEVFRETPYLITSSKVEFPNSPFTIRVKKELMNWYGITNDYIKEERVPYQPEFIKELPLGIFIMAVGAKDADRFKFNKKDGSPGYFQPFTSIAKCETYDKHGYIYTLPHVHIKLSNKEEMNGTSIRKYLGEKYSKDRFLEVFGFYDEDLYQSIYSQLCMNESIEIPIEIGDTVLGGRFKNKKITVKSIGRNEKGDITINDKPFLKIRLTK